MIRPRIPAAAGLLLAATLLLQGCSVNPALRVPDAIAPAGVLLLDNVPFHAQTDYQCGPAALATVLGASGIAASPEALAPQVYLPGRQGSLQVELLAATRRAGRIPYLVDGVPEALFDELRTGRPVLVMQNLWVRTLPKWHYAVVVGADPARNRLILNSGDRLRLRMRGPTFLRTWDWAGRWGMVALRPGELPARADVGRYLSAVADFEQVAGAAAAAPGYRVALQQWPHDPRPQLALGNQAYAAKDRLSAVRHYRAGLLLSPHDPVLGNNLASVLGELGCASEARAAIAVARQGLSMDSPWREALGNTESELATPTVPRDRVCGGLK